MAEVLSELADILSESPELPESLGCVAGSVRRLIPFDDMAVARIVEGGRAVLHASTDTCSRFQGPLAGWSPRWRPGPTGLRIDEVQADLDASFPMDAEAMAKGLGSILWAPFQLGRELAGGLWLCSRATHAFRQEHETLLRSIAVLLGSAAEHCQIRDDARRRRERLDRVESLLGALAESLDVRESFQRLSGELQTILPHDLVNLTEMDLRARTIRIAAFAGDCDLPVSTEEFPLTEREVEDRQDFAIVHDIRVELAPDTERHRLIRQSGMRSWLHVPLWQSGEIKGSLSFLHREPSRYRNDDAEVALLVAARVALTLSHERLAEEARKAAESRARAERLEATVETLARDLESRGRGQVIGVSRSWKETLRHVGRVADSDTTVLITGESGTGKEVISHLIHRGSRRAGRPFVAINCAALPELLLESELFGHEKGAFTGAIATKIGRIEQAEGGTLFLDEVAEMIPSVQAKLLRVLEELEFQRVGGARAMKADVRIIAATNRDLAASIARHAFREDLFYRLNVFQIHIAPLRERPEDILPLAESFVGDLSRTTGRATQGISAEARAWMVKYAWPGNVREMRNAIERAILLCDGGPIASEHLIAPTARSRAASATGETPAGTTRTAAPEGVNLESMERGLIEKALGQSNGNKTKAARLLGLTRSQLYTRLQKHRLGSP